ncbi:MULTISPECIES: DUF1622 domain-containing protein [unclassified Cyanobium]|uniref:DUF1622 domain-containing protein n=1 Tax=unclassified Cyanobium TaxID=2627006 RepID=UPI0020CF9029|nr:MULTISPECIES: DUF1622 domain-containing protein [unclassified Cyanobium]MCP9833814.1 DUF1622 domain-containing protein [Cyanobium sp. La Preciosa 7G6]MCP9936428.1 DUF1622 domain-containing protein [Cyanobium sp. Aljojuca 7A6]
MPWLESPEALLQGLAGVVRFTLEFFSVLCVAAGVITTLRLALPFLPVLGHRGRRPPSTIRINFGSWLSMALEFQLGADIVATTAAPSESNLIQLAAERRLEQDRPLSPKP